MTVNAYTKGGRRYWTVGQIRATVIERLMSSIATWSASLLITLHRLNTV